MYVLFTRLTDEGGPFVVVRAFGGPAAGRDGDAGVSWTVVVRDDARLPLPGVDIRALYRISDADGFVRLLEGRHPDGLCVVEEVGEGGEEKSSDPVATLTWHEVLRALVRLPIQRPDCTIERIVGTAAREPRYHVRIRLASGVDALVFNYDDIDRLCLEGGPLGDPSTTRPHQTGALASVISGSRAADVVTAWEFQRGRQPLQLTRGSLPLITMRGSAYVWVDLEKPTADDLRATARALDLPYRLVLVSLSADGQPRILPHRDYVALRITAAHRDSLLSEIVTEPFDIILGHNVLVTVHEHPLPALKRALMRGATMVDDAPSLARLILAELLASDEALARWMEREADVHWADAPRAPKPLMQIEEVLHTRQAAAALRQASEGRFNALIAMRVQGEARRASPTLISRSALSHLLKRERRLATSLRVTEERADGAVRVLVARATWYARARRASLIHLAFALGAAASVGLVRLILVRMQMSAIVVGATALMCLLILGVSAVMVARATSMSDHMEQQARALWDGEEGEIE